ncbi:uncharacterized protein [Aristolochia californica]|uniref:uncharacterized protein isoform X2 n=1 Tax=Aristolochia californica TaxID=171875 RepID=UPI0035E21E9E
MSHREGRDTHTKWSHTKLEKDPSPKRPRRDGKPIEGISSTNHDVEITNLRNEDEKHLRQLQDPLPLEPSAALESKIETDSAKRGVDMKTNGLLDGTNHSSDPTEVPRSRSYYQRDGRGSAGQGGQSNRRRHTDRRRWSDRMERSDGRGDRAEQHDLHRRDERTRKPDDKSTWHHDGFFELEAEVPPARKRPAFREKKDLPEQGNAGAKREERSEYDQHGNDKAKGGDKPDDRSVKTVGRPLRRRDTYSVGFASRDRLGNGPGFQGRDRFNGRYGERSQNQRLDFQVEKWKHDLFDEANQSPPPKNEEDQIAKVEALLAL